VFGLINFTAVLEHLHDPSAVLRKTVGWLKPDGVMLIDVPSSAFLLSRAVRAFYRLSGNDFVSNTCPMHVPYHLYEFGEESFRRNSRLGGYSVVHIDMNPGGGYLPPALQLAFDKVMRWTRTGMQLLVWLRKNA
jgi:SAM-dependent methyltransferase